MICNTCQQQIPEDSSFCKYCGVRQDAFAHCTACKQEIPAGSSFCNNCGAQQDATPPPQSAKYLPQEFASPPPPQGYTPAQPVSPPPWRPAQYHQAVTPSPGQSTPQAPQPQASQPPQDGNVPPQTTTPPPFSAKYQEQEFASSPPAPPQPPQGGPAPPQVVNRSAPRWLRPCIFFAVLILLITLITKLGVKPTDKPAGAPTPISGPPMAFSHTPKPRGSTHNQWNVDATLTLGITYKEYREACSTALNADYLPTAFTTEGPYRTSAQNDNGVKVMYQMDTSGKLTVLCVYINLDVYAAKQGDISRLVSITPPLLGSTEESATYTQKSVALAEAARTNYERIATGRANASDAWNWFAREEIGGCYYFYAATGHEAFLIASAIDELPFLDFP